MIIFSKGNFAIIRLVIAISISLLELSFWLGGHRLPNWPVHLARFDCPLPSDGVILFETGIAYEPTKAILHETYPKPGRLEYRRKPPSA